jgi:hypothetical protein
MGAWFVTDYCTAGLSPRSTEHLILVECTRPVRTVPQDVRTSRSPEQPSCQSLQILER